MGIFLLIVFCFIGTDLTQLVAGENATVDTAVAAATGIYNDGVIVLSTEENVSTSNNQTAATATSTTTAAPPAIPSTTRRSMIGNANTPINRDVQLMSLLAARRNALVKDKVRPSGSTNLSLQRIQQNDSVNNDKLIQRRECEKNCTSNFTTRAAAGCMRKCALLYKIDLRNLSSSTNRNIATLNSKIEVGEKEFNTIAEELLDTEESQATGLYHVQPNNVSNLSNSNRYAPNVPETKDISGKGNYKSNVIENGLRQTSTEKIYSKLQRTTAPSDGRYKRIDATKIRNRLPVTLDTSSSVEAADLNEYLPFGQKLPLVKPNVSKNQVSLERQSDLSKLASKMSDDEEPVEVFVLKPNYDRNKLRRYNPTVRNVVAPSRKLISARSGLDTATLSTSKPPALPIKLSADEPTNSTDLVESLQSNNSSISNETIVVANNTKNEQNTPLLIHVPDPEENAATEQNPPPTEKPIVQIPPASKPMYAAYPPEETSNLIQFFNVTTTTTKSPVQIEQPTLPEEVANKTDEQDSSTTKSFTRTTVSSSVRSTINPINKDNSTDLSNGLPTTPLSKSVLSEEGASSTTTPDVALEANNATSTNSSQEERTNVFNLSSIFPNFSGMNVKMPTIPDLSAIISNSTKPKFDDKHTDSSVLLSHNNDVTIEMHRMNMATYVLAGLGMFPIVIIILYVGKTILFRKTDKSTADIDSYVSECQKPISQVVKLDHSADQPSYGDESIMTENSFNRNYLKFKNLLGEGNFGQVWKAEADDLVGHMGTTRIVAVKTERCGTGNGGLRDEAAIMKKLGSHPNVVTLLGACVEKEPHLLIMEFAMRGRLLSLLRAARASSTPPSANMQNNCRNFTPLSQRRLAGFAHDIAAGMEYISDKKIVHRDLAARNILLDHNGICKICDFGMSIDLDKSKKIQRHTRKVDIFGHQTNPVESPRFRFDFHRRSFYHDRKVENCKRPALPIRWMAPEALQYHIFSSETDVWAFGIVLWEIASLGCTPYPTLSGREVVRNIPNGTRPEIPNDCRPELYELMTRTWQKDSRLRPTFSEARTELAQSLCQWEVDDTTSDYLDVSGFSEDLEHGMVYFNRRISEFECEI